MPRKRKDKGKRQGRYVQTLPRHWKGSKVTVKELLAGGGSGALCPGTLNVCSGRPVLETEQTCEQHAPVTYWCIQNGPVEAWHPHTKTLFNGEIS
jgi:hypothetical protein